MMKELKGTLGAGQEASCEVVWALPATRQEYADVGLPMHPGVHRHPGSATLQGLSYFFFFFSKGKDENFKTFSGGRS